MTSSNFLKELMNQLKNSSSLLFADCKSIAKAFVRVRDKYMNEFDEDSPEMDLLTGSNVELCTNLCNIIKIIYTHSFEREDYIKEIEAILL